MGRFEEAAEQRCPPPMSTLRRRRLKQLLNVSCILFLLLFFMIARFYVRLDHSKSEYQLAKWSDSNPQDSQAALDKDEDAIDEGFFDDDDDFDWDESDFNDIDVGRTEAESLEEAEADEDDSDEDSNLAASKDTKQSINNPAEPEIEIFTMLDRNHREIFSLTTRDRKFIPFFFEGMGVYNPSIIPHPTRHDMWIAIAKRGQGLEKVQNDEEVVCNAGLFDDVLVCAETPTVLPVSPSIPGQCKGDFKYLNYRLGARDMRMFYGADAPYIIYGSHSQSTCMGLWLQDARMLLDPFHLEKFTLTKSFKVATEVRRPQPLHEVEKNYFLFWSSEGKAYVHYDIFPERVFAPLNLDGSVDEDLAPLAASKDSVCMAKFMPEVDVEQESLQQATNSLSITLCKRSDPKCIPDKTNTFIMHIFHHSTNYDNHTMYEPYAMLFQQTAPFALRAIGQRPLWIHGREGLTAATGAVQYRGREDEIPDGHTEMFQITSISWKTHSQKYHGYIDDPLFLAFGIEESRGGAIDVLASDILQDLAFC